jgi:predicted glycoside hydrolase/deacetylase ChbG (UPF0249 family)
VTELVSHPGLDDGSLRAAYSWGYEWEREAAALCDPAVRQRISQRQIELTSFSAIAGRSAM